MMGRNRIHERAVAECRRNRADPPLFTAFDIAWLVVSAALLILIAVTA
jgi:hypothetical protein